MRFQGRYIIIIVIKGRIIGGRLCAAAGWQDDSIVIGGLERGAAAVIIFKVKMTITAADVGPLVFFLPFEIGRGATDACRGVCAGDFGACAGFRAKQ